LIETFMFDSGRRMFGSPANFTPIPSLELRPKGTVVSFWHCLFGEHWGLFVAKGLERCDASMGNGYDIGPASSHRKAWSLSVFGCAGGPQQSDRTVKTGRPGGRR
jgi:hypothetical protein